MNITLSRLHFPVSTLGHGKRIGVWFQGCSIACKGCVSTDTWPNDQKKNIELDTLYPLLREWLPDANGATISGGEPFEQPEALYTLLQFFREETKTRKTLNPFSIFIYSGYSLEALQPQLKKLQSDGLVDALMTDPFEILQPQTKPLRGSDNQRLSLLTPLGETHFANYQQAKEVPDKTLDMMVTGDQFWLAGVPLQKDLPKLVDRLHQQGHQACATQKTSTKSRI